MTRILRLVVVLAALFAGAAAAQNIHLGVKSCGSSGCHGQVASETSPVLLNEYVTWQKYDKHAGAYKVLLNPRSQRMAANLGLPNASEAQICLDCHSDNPPEAQRGPQYVQEDGVGCEACHGGGGGAWMGPHIGGVSHDVNLQNGLVELEDPVVRAEVCLKCHLGDDQQFASHRIMGAGHPRISFELDSFTAFQPAHFVIDEDYRARKKVVDGVRTWAIGQALAVERRMDLLIDSKYSTDGLFPELAFFDCYSCHQNMSGALPDKDGNFPAAWRARPASGAGPGVVKFNDSNMLMLETALDLAGGDLADGMAAQIRALHQASRNSRADLLEAAKALRVTARAAVDALAAAPMDKAAMRGAVSSLIARGDKGYYTDYETAEQSTMAIGAIVEAMRTAGYVDEAGYERLSKAMELVYAAVGDDEKFIPGAYADTLKGLKAAL